MNEEQTYQKMVKKTYTDLDQDQTMDILDGEQDGENGSPDRTEEKMDSYEFLIIRQPG